ncbi:MAG: type II toxin-antitoxin system RelE/ParE family toxin [Nanoarchaeota archaeon]|nr:type II toxin-antitoxin system RelE/ParE family toxin [Nanoarchaeota archaeon]MBU1134989.1 type II toxin-antitoxin system RelE/ParE family toxin [Nanoarchaeota archaeon]MBU2520082.1 type II toxin-antitoxin system RelE/ParE family toxin [Nanoarchaeota archaeon]
MVYRIDITETAQKEIFKKLEPFLIERLDKRIKKLEDEPKIYGKPLKRPLIGIWEIRFEKRWRVWYKINDDQKLVEIVGFKHKDEM